MDKIGGDNMYIEFGLKNNIPYVESDINKRNQSVLLSEYEQEFLNTIFEILDNAEFDIDIIYLERRTNNYLSLVINNDIDFLRVKITDRTKWFSLDMWWSNKGEYDKDERISSDVNKKQRHWKFKFNCFDDIVSYQDLICNSYKQCSTRG